MPMAPEDEDALVMELEATAREAADRIVRTWLPMMFGAEELRELCLAYGVAPAAEGEEYEALFERLTEPFTAAHLSQLHRPPGDLVPLLLTCEGSNKDARQGWGSKLDMYWRGALSLHKLKIPMLQSMLQKRPHLHEYLAEGLEDDAGNEDPSVSTAEHTLSSDAPHPPTEEEMGAITDPQQQFAEQAEPTTEQAPPQKEQETTLEPRHKLRMIQALLPEYTMVAETLEYHEKRKQQEVKRKKKLEADIADDSPRPETHRTATEDQEDDGEDVIEEVESRAKVASKSAAGKKRQPEQPQINHPVRAADDFSAATSFSGKREGWIFTMGRNGLGYYRDNTTASATGDVESAAKHTYDHGYKKWEKYDADAEAAQLDSDDEGDSVHARPVEPQPESMTETAAKPEPEPQLEPEPEPEPDHEFVPEPDAATDNDPQPEQEEADEPLFDAPPPVRLPQRAEDTAQGQQSEPSSAEEWKAAGTSALKEGRFDDAAAAYRRALACMPPRPPPRSLEEEEEDSSLEEDPLGGSGGGTPLSEEQLAAYERKVAEVEAQETEKAKAKQKLNKIEEMRLALHNNLALVALRQEDWSEAVRAADEALELEPASAKALYRRGVSNYELQMKSQPKFSKWLNAQSQLDAKAVEQALSLAQKAWVDLVKAQALLPGDKGLRSKLKEVEGWLQDQRGEARKLRDEREREQRKAEASRSKYSADYGRFDNFDPATDSDDENNAASVERERVSRLAKLDELKGLIERSGDDQASLDKAFDWVSKAAKENEGRRIVLNLTTSDRSRSASFGIGMRAHFTKLMEKFTAMVLPAGESKSSVRFEWQGRELKSSDTPEMVGLCDGDTVVAFVN